jgi:hypothetical protein
LGPQRSSNDAPQEEEIQDFEMVVGSSSGSAVNVEAAEGSAEQQESTSVDAPQSCQDEVKEEDGVKSKEADTETEVRQSERCSMRKGGSPQDSVPSGAVEGGA